MQERHTGPSPGVRRHYSDFYDGFDEPAGRPVLVAVGNCQAESHRLALDGPDVRTVRIPAIHELAAYDLDPLLAVLRRADLVVSQPVTKGYRGLPVGTAALRQVLRPDARLVLVPALRFAGQHPFHVVVHPPQLVDPHPPLVAYHDVRTAIAAAWEAAGRAVPPPPTLTQSAVRAIAAHSVREMERRQRQWSTVPVADLFAGGRPPLMRTVNHPGNDAFVRVAGRLRSALGLGRSRPRLDRPLLDRVHAPVDEVVRRVYPTVEVREDWTVGGASLDVATVAARHRAWYRDRPDVLAEVLRRTGWLRQQLDLADPGSC